MKIKVKPLFLILAIAVLMTILMIPVKNHARTLQPGITGVVSGLESCICPVVQSHNCGCSIVDPSGT